MRYYQTRKMIFTTVVGLSASIVLFSAFGLEFGIGGIREIFPYVIAMASAFVGVVAVLTLRLTHGLEKHREGRRIFLIYAREDLEIAKELSANLADNGFNPWLDVEQIAPGQIWQKAVLRALEESVVALVLVSKQLGGKESFVRNEIKVALETLEEKETDLSPVIPVRLDDSDVPDVLAHVQWVNLFEEKGMQRLLVGLKKAVDKS